ncbi:MAG: DUF1353 domain-containing protein [Gammaproteobacteria bacterium]|nr:DUF1353 domain-containing protein [Gammaproteobacteria bacterium]
MIRSLACTILLAMVELHPANATGQNNAGILDDGGSPPAVLIEKAGEMFSGLLADQVAAQITADLQQAIVEDPSWQSDRSIGTLFLANIFYPKVGIGEYYGTPQVIWNGFDVKAQRPTFVYSASNFAYTTANGRVITPGLMNTDGGSIPKVLHSIGDFTPWGYGPAYIIHDWLFVAYKCGIQPDDDVSFEESAEMIAEMIKTLMETGFVNYDGETQIFPKSKDTLYLIYQAVKSPVARALWNDQASVVCR